ncbi:hypothetical protein CJ030_MR5G023743 [Morella rubra]|uniref:Late embryogenesis abundant protein LEA-2 subgroup domain-containing protein n=1 Tax=Morella rubra TaxID=262757 RepID=A0A6A1VGF6_9ROSI|nr:hypothetical protein CJ030_MR5G023743 [Morella rubra]
MIKMNSLALQKVDLVNGSLAEDANITVVADVSVKNPNVVSFTYDNSTSTISYHGTVVGETRIPSGKAKAKHTVQSRQVHVHVETKKTKVHAQVVIHTLRMNMTIHIVADKVLAVPGLSSDWTSRALTLNSYTKLSGRVKILNIIKRNVVSETNRTIHYNVTSGAIVDECNPRVSV